MKFRVVDENPYRDTIEEYRGLEPKEAISRWDDLTGEGDDAAKEAVVLLGTGLIEPPVWTDPETGREVTMTVEAVES